MSDFLCPKCKQIISLNNKTCNSCSAMLIVESLDYFRKQNQQVLQEYLKFYRDISSLMEDNSRLNKSIGLCYLALGIKDLAAKYLYKAVENEPSEGDVYYSYAISLLNKKPRLLKLNEAREIEKNLELAIKLDGKQPKYYFILAAIKYDFYVKNGLIVRPPEIQELIIEGCKIMSYNNKNREES